MPTTWSERAEHYAHSEMFKYGPGLEKLLALARPTWSDSCVDIGAAAGHTAAALAKYAANVLGIDSSEGMLRQAMGAFKQVDNLEFAFGFAHDTGLLANSYDIVTVRHAAHHFASIPSFLDEVKRILKPGGRLVIVDEVSANSEIDDWFNALEHLRDAQHHRAYLLREWFGFVRAAKLNWVIGDDRTRLHIDVAAWLARANLDSEERSTVYEHFLSASPTERNTLNLKFEGKTAVSFDLPLGVMLATKPLENSPKVMEEQK